MEEVETSRRKALQAAIAALCVEVGFMSIEKDALGVLTEILQSCKYVRSLFQLMHSSVVCYHIKIQPTLFFQTLLSWGARLACTVSCPYGRSLPSLMSILLWLMLVGWCYELRHM